MASEGGGDTTHIPNASRTHPEGIGATALSALVLCLWVSPKSGKMVAKALTNNV